MGFPDRCLSVYFRRRLFRTDEKKKDRQSRASAYAPLSTVVDLCFLLHPRLYVAAPSCVNLCRLPSLECESATYSLSNVEPASTTRRLNKLKCIVTGPKESLLPTPKSRSSRSSKQEYFICMHANTCTQELCRITRLQHHARHQRTIFCVSGTAGQIHLQI